MMVAESPGLCASEAAVTPFTGKGARLLNPGQVSWMAHRQHFLMTTTYKPESGSISQPQPWDRTTGPAAAQFKAWILVPSGSTPAERGCDHKLMVLVGPGESSNALDRTWVQPCTAQTTRAQGRVT